MVGPKFSVGFEDPETSIIFVKPRNEVTELFKHRRKVVVWLVSHV